MQRTELTVDEFMYWLQRKDGVDVFYLNTLIYWVEKYWREYRVE
jgi:hypothetical protein